MTGSLTNPFVTICVDSSAFPRHIQNHGDYFGTCSDVRIFGTRKRTDAEATALKEKSGKRLDVKATPNPSAGYFTLKTLSVSGEPLQLKVLDMLGRVVETKSNIAANSTITFGSQYRPGPYLVEVIQGAEKRKLRMLKL